MAVNLEFKNGFLINVLGKYAGKVTSAIKTKMKFSNGLLLDKPTTTYDSTKAGNLSETHLLFDNGLLIGKTEINYLNPLPTCLQVAAPQSGPYWAKFDNTTLFSNSVIANTSYIKFPCTLRASTAINKSYILINGTFLEFNGGSWINIINNGWFTVNAIDKKGRVVCEGVVETLVGYTTRKVTFSPPVATPIAGFVIKITNGLAGSLGLLPNAITKVGTTQSVKFDFSYKIPSDYLDTITNSVTVQGWRCIYTPGFGDSITELPIPSPLKFQWDGNSLYTYYGWQGMGTYTYWIYRPPTTCVAQSTSRMRITIGYARSWQSDMDIVMYNPYPPYNLVRDYQRYGNGYATSGVFDVPITTGNIGNTIYRFDWQCDPISGGPSNITQVELINFNWGSPTNKKITMSSVTVFNVCS